MRFAALIRAFLPLACLPLALAAQEAEIFIPGGTVNVPQQAGSALADCLANPGVESCAAAAATGGFESATGSDLAFETLVLDLDGGTVASSPAPATPDYSAPPQGKVSYPAVAVTIQFDFDSAALRLDQLVKLGELAIALRDPTLAETGFAIIGHTDAKGSEAYNCDLSERRAITVAETLLANGVYLPVFALGFGEHVLKNSYDPNAAENRRVTFLRLPLDAAPVLQTARAVCGY